MDDAEKDVEAKAEAAAEEVLEKGAEADSIGEDEDKGVVGTEFRRERAHALRTGSRADCAAACSQSQSSGIRTLASSVRRGA